MLNVHQILSSPKVESLIVTGTAPDVVKADGMAWGGLESVLGGDPVGHWALKSIEHTVGQMEDGSFAVAFKADFYRKPDEEEV